MTNDETRKRATYTDDNFEEYCIALIKTRCDEKGWIVNDSAEEGSIQNNRDDAFGFDPETGYDDDQPSYTDDDIWDEYVYFLIWEGLDDYLTTTPFHNRNLSPVHDDQEMTYEMNVYREGDKPYSHYDVSRMDLYRGTYAIDDKGSISFTLPVKVEFDV